MSEVEAWDAGRGLWKMSRERLARQRFALVTGEGLVRAVAEITGATVIDGRTALDGQLLAAGHALWDAYFGKPDPIVTESQNPVAYGELPEERPFQEKPCACGCGALGRRDFLPGHDVRAIQTRVRAHFDSPLEFIRWVDTQLGLGTDAAPASVEETSVEETPVERDPEKDHEAAAAAPADPPPAVPPIIEALQEVVIRYWLPFESVGWTRLAESAAQHGIAATTRAKLADALTEAFGENAPMAVRDRRRTWVYSVADLWAAVNTWRVTHGFSNPLEYCYDTQDAKAFTDLLREVLSVNHGLDTTNKNRLLTSLRERGVHVPTAQRSRLTDVLRRYRDDVPTWLHPAPDRRQGHHDQASPAGVPS